MLRPFRAFLIVVPLLLAGGSMAQADEICREFGQTPSREIGRQGRLAQFVFGRIVLKGVAPGTPTPRVTVTYSDIVQPATRQLVGQSGSYCFKRLGASAMIVVEVDGVEAGRKSFSDLGNARQREDLEILVPNTQQAAAPGVVSTRFTRAPNDKTTELYKKAAAAETEKDLNRAVEYVREVVAIDTEDFIAWAKLGSLYLSLNSLPEAETSLKRAIAVRHNYTPALLNLGTLLAVQGQVPAAIELFKRGVVSDPTSARAYRLLGEAYLQNREGTMGLAALDEALRLDPVGMAECHLLKARLYDLAGAKNLASAEYRAFLAKAPNHEDRKKLEKYIKDNPE